MRQNQFRNWMEVKPTVGTFVVCDEWAHGAVLNPCDDWDKADFRLPGHVPFAVNVVVTGRTLQNPFGLATTFVRCKVVFVGDCAPDVEVRGWMEVTEQNKVFKE